jgi:hypothetical protein
MCVTSFSDLIEDWKYNKAANPVVRVRGLEVPIVVVWT